MILKAGSRLGAYEILALIGRGGMGEVYRAQDTKLGREVAIKVLPETFARDPDRLARFRREAHLLASLNHSNIAAIYGLEDANGLHFLVLELVLGDTLADRLKAASTSAPQAGPSAPVPSTALRKGKAGPTGAIEVEETLRIAVQIAKALEAAHEKNIIHRDLKPANVKVTPEGQVKVLDFGLAKALADETPGGDPSDSPTLTAGPTQPGVILGTAAYMAPEQARGRKVDRRADTWAFGCVLYELLTGQRAFRGEDVTDTLAAVMRGEPDWQVLPETTPISIRSLLRRCLQKDVTRRYHSASDIRIEIEETLAATSAPAAPRPMATVPPRTLWRWAAFSGLACLVLGSLITGMIIWNLKPTPPRPVTRTVVALPPGDRLSASAFQPLALSPDGTHIVYVASRGEGRQLYLRSMDSLEAGPLNSTEGADQPFFSPDGQWVGFFAGGNLKKVPLSGGAVLTLCAASAIWGASWGTNDRIVFAPASGSALFQVSAAGGTPEVLTKLDASKGEFSHRWPEFLPGSKAVLFTAGVGTGEDAQIMVQRLDTGERKVLVQGGTYPHYVPTGHLVYYRAGAILAVPFDLSRLEVSGSPTPIVEGVTAPAGNSGAAQFSFSSNGLLAYVPGGSQGTLRTLVWVDRKGMAEPLKAPPRPYASPKVSPDGQQLAVIIAGPKSDVWIYNLARDTLTRLTFEGNNTQTSWTRDGKRVMFASGRGGAPKLFWKPADGSGAEERLTTGEYQHYPGSFTPDGRTLLYAEAHPQTGRDLLVMSLEGDRKPRVFLRTQFNETSPRFSSDGRWVAYNSDESGRNEIYVQPFPGPGGKYQISTEGGREFAWAANGELFYRTGDKMMAVEIKTQPTLIVGKPRMLFEGHYEMNTGVGANYDVTADGQRFIMLKGSEQAVSATQINVVLNWFEELKRRVPVK